MVGCGTEVSPWRISRQLLVGDCICGKLEVQLYGGLVVTPSQYYFVHVSQLFIKFCVVCDDPSVP